MNKISTLKEYKEVMQLIQSYLAKATDLGGFGKLNKEDADTLEQLTILAEKYEDEEMKIMPLPERQRS